jgi:uncharacterized protein (TIGR00255 family)
MTQLNSMTGFGRVETQIPDASLEIEIRSVNHRYLDLQFRLPDGFRRLEPMLRQLVAGSIKRGKVDATVTLTQRHAQDHTTQINVERADEVIEQLQTLAARIDNPAPISAIDIIRSTGVLVEHSINPEEYFDAVEQAMTAAIGQLHASRLTEGNKLAQMIEERCVDILEIASVVTKRLPTVLTEIRAKLAQRVETLQVQIDQDRLEQELVMIAQKLDVSEELDRLKAHITEVRATFDSGEPIGRRLDFLMQELNREANTLGSKSADTETTKAAVDLKVLIEQMREQVQNVE